jgi:hypothetical protein
VYVDGGEGGDVDHGATVPSRTLPERDVAAPDVGSPSLGATHVKVPT